MGYRSDLAVRIYGGKEDIEEFGLFYEQTFDKLSNEVQLDVLSLEEYSKQETGKDVWHTNEKGETEFFFVANSIKWYEGYPEVDFFEDMFNQPLWHVKDLNIEYIRIGEESNDIDEIYRGENNEYRMSVHRIIDLGE